MSDQMVIFDGDDTLWETMPLYTAAKEQFFAALGKLGFSSSTIPAVFEKIDLENLEKFGFGRRRFPASMVDTYRSLCREREVESEIESEKRIWEIGNSVFEGRPTVFPNAKAVLDGLRKRFKLVLLTKGEDSVQRNRVEQSGLKCLFDGVHIVASKEQSDFTELLRKYASDPKMSWSVGNSLRADINPALRAGMGAIWIPYTTWDAEVDEPVSAQRFYKVSDLAECLTLLGGT